MKLKIEATRDYKGKLKFEKNHTPIGGVYHHTMADVSGKRVYSDNYILTTRLGTIRVELLPTCL